MFKNKCAGDLLEGNELNATCASNFCVWQGFVMRVSSNTLDAWRFDIFSDNSLNKVDLSLDGEQVGSVSGRCCTLLPKTSSEWFCYIHAYVCSTCKLVERGKRGHHHLFHPPPSTNEKLPLPVVELGVTVSSTVTSLATFVDILYCGRAHAW